MATNHTFTGAQWTLWGQPLTSRHLTSTDFKERMQTEMLMHMSRNLTVVYSGNGLHKII